MPDYTFLCRTPFRLIAIALLVALFSKLAFADSVNCVISAGVLDSDVTVQESEIDSRQDLRDRIARDVQLSVRLQKEGCEQIGLLFSERANYLKRDLLAYTKKTNSSFGRLSKAGKAFGFALSLGMVHDREDGGEVSKILMDDLGLSPSDGALQLSDLVSAADRLGAR